MTTPERAVYRSAVKSDVDKLVSLINATIDTCTLASAYYSRPTIKKWRAAASDAFLDSHVVADLESLEGSSFTAGYARFQPWDAGNEPCGYIKGPWMDPSLDTRLSCSLGLEIINHCLEKMRDNGLSIALAHVPLFLPERLSLFKELGFTSRDRIHSYSKRLTGPVTNGHRPDSVEFFRYLSSSVTDDEIVALYCTAFPGEQFTAEAFASVKAYFNDFTGNGAMFLARMGDQLAGMVWSIHRGLSCEISGLCIDPVYRRRGIARSLVFLCLERAATSGIDRVEATISEDNQASISTFTSCSFSRIPASSLDILEKKLKAPST